MWNADDRKSSTETPKPPAAAPAASGAQPGAVQGKQAYISKSIRIEGSVTGAADLVVDGQLKGTIHLPDQSVTIGPDGVVDAEVEAREIRVQGRLSGNARAKDRIAITKTGSVEGEVTTARIAVEDGAVFRGSVNIETPEPAASAALVPAKPAAVQLVKSGGASNPKDG